CEQVVLPAQVIVEAADHATPREGDVRLHRRPGQQALAAKLAEPAPLVLEQAQRDPHDSLHTDADAHLFTPVSSIVRPVSARCCRCWPAPSHQPRTGTTETAPRCAYARLTSVISSSPRLERSRLAITPKTSGG